MLATVVAGSSGATILTAASAGANTASSTTTTTPTATGPFETDHGLTVYPNTPAGNHAINKRIKATNHRCPQTLFVSSNKRRDQTRYGRLSIKAHVKRKDGAHIIVQLTHLSHGQCGLVVYRKDQSTVFPVIHGGKYVDPWVDGDPSSISNVQAAVDRK